MAWDMHDGDIPASEVVESQVIWDRPAEKPQTDVEMDAAEGIDPSAFRGRGRHRNRRRGEGRGVQQPLADDHLLPPIHHDSESAGSHAAGDTDQPFERLEGEHSDARSLSDGQH